MAWNFAPSSSLPKPPPWVQATERVPTKNQSVLFKPTSSEKCFSPCKASQSESVAEDTSPTSSSARNQLDLLEQLTSSSPTASGYDSLGDPPRPTIREQLSEIVGDRDGEFILPLGKKLKASLNTLTISQKRNIKRQAYLNEVEQRNDSVFFATIGAFVLLPPAVILSVAILTGYVQLFP
ncbi:uncharacterized protein LOC135580991 isoform X2 [Musa acuminata AAA Group]|uniref:(wild Malaysian banana) hypothetical protein n=1 Tax=Musa acuminata subsp. malaccensis TaxID=214687 RepID=A0A804HWR9_MUSAM|nr:PREDICTED: uncharacterized protein LOC103999804 [Musa acuminata subsp. malaccensis]CAG1860117.1 unnamed protein product [Musa acuminata subsp. malaccensis]